MYVAFTILIAYFFPPALAGSCSASRFRCGKTTLDIMYPFYTNTSSQDCQGIYLIQCINLTPLIKFPGQDFMYPVYSISYPEQILIIHDLKLSLSPYPWGPDCIFLYDFRAPIRRANITQLSLVISSGLASFFNCRQKDYDFHHNIFSKLFHFSVCKDYDLYYTYSRPDEGLPAHCSTSGAPLYFFWKLLFSEAGSDGWGFSLLSAGFSCNWELQPADYFDCQIKGGDCPGGATRGDSKCSCNRICRGSNSKAKKRNIIIGVFAAISGSILVCVLCYLLYLHKKKIAQYPPSSPLIRIITSSKQSFKKDSKLDSTDYPTHIFSYNELLEATNSFDASQELGDGGFGTVYKGKLRDGRTVAVKRLYENNYKRFEQFMNEIEILSRLRHQNLVSLYGCNSHRSRDLLLVYEYVPNGTVADHLHGPCAADQEALTWPLRMKIAIETAEALAYLHAVEPPVIHRDVKTNNILLDDNFTVKVADFGLSRLFPADATHVSTAPQGTPGYLDPEYHQCYQLTDKSDVYSFGVVLVELISSKQAVDVSRQRSEINLATMALSRIQKQELEGLVDPGLGYRSDSEVTRMITLVAELAFRCLQADRDMRPPIKEVLGILKGIQTGECMAEKAMKTTTGVSNIRVDAPLLMNNGGPFSPNSVTEKWESRSTTPSDSYSGLA